MALKIRNGSNFSVIESWIAAHGLVILVTGFYGEIPSVSLENGASFYI